MLPAATTASGRNGTIRAAMSEHSLAAGSTMRRVTRADSLRAITPDCEAIGRKRGHCASLAIQAERGRRRQGGAWEPDLTSDEELQRLLDNPRFARASRYPARWVAENQMGPNALWLTEWLCEGLDLEPGMRVLDLGCGRALSSIYLAREHGVQVMACDLWVAAGDNFQRVVAAGADDLVTPIQAEAHALPFAETFFDAIVSLDAYTYFGTDDLYLGYILRYLGAGGRIGIVVPGLMREIRTPPAHLTRPQAHGRAFWEPDCWCFHTAAWWRRHWRRTGLVDAIRDRHAGGRLAPLGAARARHRGVRPRPVPLRCRGDRGGSRPHARLRARDRAAQAPRRRARRRAACLGARLPRPVRCAVRGARPQAGRGRGHRVSLWLVLGAMTALAAALVAWPLLRPPAAPSGRRDYELRVYRAQLEELARERERGLLGEREAEAAKLEVERRMLAADAARPAIWRRARVAARRPQPGRPPC